MEWNRLTPKIFGMLVLMNFILLVPMVVSWYVPLSKSMEDVMQLFGFISLLLFSPSWYLLNLFAGSSNGIEFFSLPTFIIQIILLYGLAFIISKSIQLIKIKEN